MQPRQRSLALWIAEPGNAAIQAEPLPALATGFVQVRAQYSGISRGTERLVFRGLVPASEYQRMRAPFQAGEFPGPVKYGYASVGVVEAGPSERLGEQVFCLHPHQTRYQVPSAAALRLPEGVPPERAVLGANMETAVNILWDAAPAVGDRIVIIGAGVVGCLTAYLCAQLPGAEVTLVDVQSARSGIAASLGARFALPEAIPGDADSVIHTSGQPAGLTTALATAGPEATIVEASWYGEQPVQVGLGGAFHSQRLTLRSSQVGHLAPARRPRWDHGKRLALALELLADPTLDQLITGECAFGELPETLARVSDGATGTLCHRVRYGNE